MNNIYERVSQNKFKSNLVVFGFVAFITLTAAVFASAFNLDYSFIGSALIFSGLGSLVSYYFSHKMILSISGAKPANREQYFDFYTVTENLCLSAQIQMPQIYVIDDTALNAFATGRDPQHAVVCATTGLLSRLDRSELEGVIAHELSHIQNYDTRLMSIVAILVGSLTLIADWLLRWSYFGRSDDKNSNQSSAIIGVIGVILALLSPIIANLIKLAISRRREFLADASAAKLTRYPEGLAKALEKISADHEPLEAANKATAHLYIANPLKNHHDSIGWFANLFSTHPPVKDRIAALRS